MSNAISEHHPAPIWHEFNWEGKSIPAHYIRVFAKNRGVCPHWHPGAGGKAWIFADEIVVE